MIRMHLLAELFSASPGGMRGTLDASWSGCRREVAR